MYVWSDFSLGWCNSLWQHQKKKKIEDEERCQDVQYSQVSIGIIIDAVLTLKHPKVHVLAIQQVHFQVLGSLTPPEVLSGLSLRRPLISC